MKCKLPLLYLLTAALFACHSADLFMMKRDDRLSQYASAIRWGAFEKAVEFQSPSHRTRLDLAWLNNIHVSTYDTLNLKEAESSNIIEQTVQIHYFNESVGVEKSIIDRQVWRYDEDKGQWMLETDLPAFR